MKVSGTAIHSGVTTTVTLHRHDGPLTFRRAGALIEATVRNVVNAQRATSLGADGAQVHMVEHLLACLSVRGFLTGVLVEADHDELPILDGSAAPWLPAVESLGEPPARPAPLVVTEPLVVRLGQSEAEVLPGPAHLSCAIDFAHPAIGRQEVALQEAEWGELLNARTFGMLAEWEYLKSQGLALGASEEHAIVFDDVGPMRPLRHPAEPVRHKALDAIGDLALLARPLQARVHIHRGSHALHHELVRSLMSVASREAGRS